MKRMPLALLCALTWACALPVSAQTAPTNPAKAQGQETRAKPDPKATGKERARMAKAQNRADCRVTKQDKPKKASAT